MLFGENASYGRLWALDLSYRFRPVPSNTVRYVPDFLKYEHLYKKITVFFLKMRVNHTVVNLKVEVFSMKNKYINDLKKHIF
jgi:hypothetical protein